MTDPHASALPWWQAREISLKRKAAEAFRAACAEPGDAFLIVTEGTVSEPVYFELLRKSLQLSTVTVKVIPGRASDPRHVVQTAADEVKALAHRVRRKRTAVDELDRFDHVWAVIDTDVAVRQGFWNDVVQKARDLNVNLAHSTPCFEFWLLLHLQKTTRADLVDGDAAKRIFREVFGRDYSTNRSVTEVAFAELLSLWPIAVRHARQVRQHHVSANTPPPPNPSTEADLLTCALNDAAQPHIRKIPCRYS
ncbi:MAG: RloB domain-containing protein [Opitutales bacterium]|nr:RloB domain-containing protein [Opitutales bacterium]